MVYEGPDVIGEQFGTNSRKAVNKTIYFIIGVCFIGTLTAIYLFFAGFGRGWKKVGKIKS